MAKAAEARAVRKTARHVRYSPKVGARVCERIAESSEALAVLCKAADMPSRRAIFHWRIRHREFERAYQLAKAQQAELLFDELAEVVREGGRLSSGNVTRDRLVWDDLRWRLSRLLPEKFGERVALEHSGQDGGPIEVSDAQAAAKIAALLEMAARRAEDDADRSKGVLLPQGEKGPSQGWAED